MSTGLSIQEFSREIFLDISTLPRAKKETGSGACCLHLPRMLFPLIHPLWSDLHPVYMYSVLSFQPPVEMPAAVLPYLSGFELSWHFLPLRISPQSQHAFNGLLWNDIHYFQVCLDICFRILSEIDTQGSVYAGIIIFHTHNTDGEKAKGSHRPWYK